MTRVETSPRVIRERAAFRRAVARAAPGTRVTQLRHQGLQGRIHAVPRIGLRGSATPRFAAASIQKNPKRPIHPEARCRAIRFRTVCRRDAALEATWMYSRRVRYLIARQRDSEIRHYEHPEEPKRPTHPDARCRAIRFRTVCRRGCGTRGYMDVFTPGPVFDCAAARLRDSPLRASRRTQTPDSPRGAMSRDQIPDRVPQGCGTRGYMDVFTPCPVFDCAAARPPETAAASLPARPRVYSSIDSAYPSGLSNDDKSAPSARRISIIHASP